MYLNHFIPFQIDNKSTFEIRVGNEKIDSFAQVLSDRNKLCQTMESMPNSLTFNVQCQSEIVGQYLTIQLMSYGQLRLDEVKVYPEPGKIFF